MISEVVVRTLPVTRPNPQIQVTNIENTGIVTILEHNKIDCRVTALVHLGNMVVKITKRRDRGLDHTTGLAELILQLAREDLANGRAEVIWELGK